LIGITKDLRNNLLSVKKNFDPETSSGQVTKIDRRKSPHSDQNFPFRGQLNCSLYLQKAIRLRNFFTGYVPLSLRYGIFAPNSVFIRSKYQLPQMGALKPGHNIR